MWSVGCVFLEIACGFPLWFSYKSRVISEQFDAITSTKKQIWLTGMMAAPGRNTDKIIQQQAYVVTNLEKCIRDYCGMNTDSRRWQNGIDLLQKMLDLNPLTRISPKDALQHPFLLV